MGVEWEEEEEEERENKEGVTMEELGKRWQIGGGEGLEFTSVDGCAGEEPLGADGDGGWLARQVEGMQGTASGTQAREEPAGAGWEESQILAGAEHDRVEDGEQLLREAW